MAAGDEQTLLTGRDTDHAVGTEAVSQYDPGGRPRDLIDLLLKLAKQFGRRAVKGLIEVEDLRPFSSFGKHPVQFRFHHAAGDNHPPPISNIRF
jgi:hypothetical protein